MQQSILIVDDCPNLHQLIRVYLAHEPIAIHSAYHGWDALQGVETLMPGLVLLDLDMPDLGGFDVCRRLKANPATQSIPVIFLTAEAAPSEHAKGLELGAIDFMSKRFKPDTLRSRVRQALRMDPVESAAAQEPGAWPHEEPAIAA